MLYPLNHDNVIIDDVILTETRTIISNLHKEMSLGN